MESVIPQLPTSFEDVSDPDGKSALIWMLGEYGEVHVQPCELYRCSYAFHKNSDLLFSLYLSLSLSIFLFPPLPTPLHISFYLSLSVPSLSSLSYLYTLSALLAKFLQIYT